MAARKVMVGSVRVRAVGLIDPFKPSFGVIFGINQYYFEGQRLKVIFVKVYTHISGKR